MRQSMSYRESRERKVGARILVRAWHGRAAVTLLEVLFSIGVVAVGLLGVLVLVPLAGSRSAQGTIADGADRLGRNAIRAFDVYQMRRPDSWAQYDAVNGNYQAFSGGEAFCIDPLYMAANTTTPATPGIRWFPYFATPPGPPANVPWMRRITLRRHPGAVLPSPVPGATNSRIMSVEQASQIFLGDDDLVFRLPTDRTLPPQQEFGSSLSKRQWEGKFSWMATLVPQLDSDLYLLSIVVFHRRDSYAEADRIVDVTFDSLGFNGGDVTLSALPSASTTTPATADDLRMKQGEWLMLARRNTVTNRRDFRWYRIQSADSGPVERDPPGSGYDRSLTLFGQDWPVSNTNVVHKAVWIPGVVAVYEKTIRLETSSLWTGL